MYEIKKVKNKEDEETKNMDIPALFDEIVSSPVSATTPLPTTPISALTPLPTTPVTHTTPLPTIHLTPLPTTPLSTIPLTQEPIPTVTTPNDGESKPLSQGFFMDSKVMLYNGEIKLCYELKINDILMGDDSRPRQLLSKTKVTNPELFIIKQKKGKPYIINRDNFITLKVSRLNPNEQKTKLLDKEYSKHDSIDIRLDDYMKLSKRRQLDFKAYKTSIDFDSQPLPFNPYLFGIWVIDSQSMGNEFSINNIDVLEACFNLCQNTNMSCNYIRENKYCILYEDDTKKDFNDVLNKLKLDQSKFIPTIYKCNSKENRLKVLAGIIDTEGFCNNNSIELTLKSPQLIEDIMFLCNSLGLYTSQSQQKNRSRIRLIISGDFSEVPLINKKKILHRKHYKNVLHSGLDIEPYNHTNDCYELKVDGNGRFVLSDFTVVHC